MSLSMVMPSPYSSVLYIGPDHRNHRGGIGAVLSIYSRNIEPFNFIPTLSYRNKVYELFFFTAALIRLFVELLTNRRIRIVHLHGAKDGSIVRKAVICFIAKKLFGKKIVFHSHAGAFNEFYLKRGRLYRQLCQFLVNNADAVVVLSDIWNEFFHETFRVKKLITIKNPVEHRQPVVLRSIDKPGIITFLFLGRIADHKGIFDLVNLFIAEQGWLRSRCKLLVGGNHEVDRLKKAITDGGVEDIVEYIGWVQDEDKDRFYNLCDYFILPTYHEAMPMTVLEAFSYGKPVLSTPVGSIPEIVVHGKNGYLFPPGDMARMKEVIFHVIRDHPEYDELKKNAMNTATDFYPESIKTALEKLYSAII